MTPPLVLIPGMMCDARLFGAQIAQFGALALVGEGETIPDMAKSVLDRAPKRFALGGLSLGGIIAMEVMAQAPERVTHLALMDTNPHAETAERKALRGPQMDRVKTGRLTDVVRDELKPNYLHDGPARQEILDLCHDMAQGLGPDVFLAQSRALRDRPDYFASLARINVPTLALCGESDALCPVAGHRKMRDAIPEAQLAVIPEAGHLPTLEQPQAVTSALSTLLERA